MTKTLADISWPVARVGEALQALGQRSGLISQSIRSETLPLDLLKGDSPDLDGWIDATALGFEAEPVAAPYTDVEQRVSGVGPALVRLQAGTEPCFLVLLKGAISRSWPPMLASFVLHQKW